MWPMVLLLGMMGCRGGADPAIAQGLDTDTPLITPILPEDPTGASGTEEDHGTPHSPSPSTPEEPATNPQPALPVDPGVEPTPPSPTEPLPPPPQEHELLELHHVEQVQQTVERGDTIEWYLADKLMMKAGKTPKGWKQPDIEIYRQDPRSHAPNATELYPELNVAVEEASPLQDEEP